MNETKTELKLIHMEDVISKEVSWLWYPYIPFGKITVIEGDPGEGKTTLILKIAALLSKGLPLPCMDDIPYEPMAVIYQTAEDGLEDTIKPRLEQAGADCSKIRVIDESEKELTMSDERLEQAIIETQAKLIILDPIQAYIGATVDMHRANEIRPVLAPVFRDDSGGYNYKLEAFRNVETKAIYTTESIKDEICSDNRIGTLEQIKGSVDVLEKQIRKLVDNSERDWSR